VEIDERIYEALAGFMIDDPSHDPEQTFRSFVFEAPAWSGQKGEKSVTLLEERAAIQAGTTGLRTWWVQMIPLYPMG
jgi:hypothetical protein